VNYTKPAITLINAAKSAIQGVKKSAPPYDGPKITDLAVTANAYEADE
jgi:hypothetical protein